MKTKTKVAISTCVSLIAGAGATAVVSTFAIAPAVASKGYLEKALLFVGAVSISDVLGTYVAKKTAEMLDYYLGIPEDEATARFYDYSR